MRPTGKATAKAAGVVIDDTAVTPQYVHGITADRELPVIKRIAIGSLRNKILFILPAALLLSQFAPFLLTPILMVGATYLCFEGAEKVWGRFLGHGGHDADGQPTTAVGGDAEKYMITGAIRTDFILSAEIMVIALNEVADQSFWPRLIILVIVALVITAAVYGVVAGIVKMDDIGLLLAQRSSQVGAEDRPRPGRRDAQAAVRAVDHRHGRDALGRWAHSAGRAPTPLAGTRSYGLVHHAEEAVRHATGSTFGGLLAWLTNTAASAVIGLVVGTVVVGIMHGAAVRQEGEARRFCVIPRPRATNVNM